MTKKRKGNGKYHDWITTEGLIKLEGWARDGLTDEQIAQNIGIVRTTLYDWKKKHPDISDALKRGKEVVDREVENALLRRALGYNYVEVRTENSEAGSKVIKTVKEVIPDTTAQIFWLKNRKPTEWRDKHEIDNTNININSDDLTSEERRDRIAELKKKLIKDDNK